MRQRRVIICKECRERLWFPRFQPPQRRRPVPAPQEAKTAYWGPRCGNPGKIGTLRLRSGQALVHPGLVQLQAVRELGSILFAAHLLQPIDSFSAELFLNGNVRHRCGGGCAVPVLLSWREPDHIAWTDLLDGTAPALRAAASGGDNERLTERMRMPGGAGAGLEGNAGAADACRAGRVKRTVPVKYSAGPLPEGTEPIRLISMLEFPPPIFRPIAEPLEAMVRAIYSALPISYACFMARLVRMSPISHAPVP